MVFFKVLILGLLGWQLVELIRLRRRKAKEAEASPPYVYATTDRPVEKELERAAPPAYYARM